MLALLKLNHAAASAALTLDSRSRLRRPLASQTRRCVVVSTREGLKYGERFWQQRSVNYFAYGSNLSTEVITVRLAFELLRIWLHVHDSLTGAACRAFADFDQQRCCSRSEILLRL